MKRLLDISPDRLACLFIDLQEEHRRDNRYLVEGYDVVLSNVQQLQAAARRNEAPLFHCAYIVDPDKELRPFHPLKPDGTSAFSDRTDPLTAICTEVAPLPGEALFIKNTASAFGSSSAAEYLRKANAEWLLVAGVWTEACVDATVKDAISLGLRVLLVKDACGSGSTAMHQTGILNLANRLYGGAVINTSDACRLLDGDSIKAWQIEGSVPLRYTFSNAAEIFAEL